MPREPFDPDLGDPESGDREPVDLDGLKRQWRAHGEVLAAAARDELAAPRLAAATARALRRATWPVLLWGPVEVAAGLVGSGLLLGCVPGHHDESLWLGIAALVLVFTLVATGHSLRRLVAYARLDFGRPVVELQRTLARLRLADYRATKWALFGGVLLWLPVALLLVEACGGPALLLRVDRWWLLANLGFGVVVLWFGQRWARRHLEVAELRPWARRLVDAWSGRAMASARAALAQVERFGGDDADHDGDDGESAPR